VLFLVSKFNYIKKGTRCHALSDFCSNSTKCFFVFFFGVLECVGQSFAYAYMLILKEVLRREIQGLKVYPVDGSPVFSMTGTYF
jgi:hypothetical protein